MGASKYFQKWGWYATLDELAKGKVWRYEFIQNMNVHEVHVALAHKIDKQKMKADIYKQNMKK